MADDIATVCGDEDDAATLTPFYFVDFQCKPEPCTSLANEDPSAFDESTTLHVPVSIPKIKDPIVLLEKCDKIWDTLQLIKTVQIEKPTALTDDCDKTEKEEKKENPQCLDKISLDKISLDMQSPYKNDPKISNNMSLPFKFSVKRTRKLYTCTICNKQYLERRSLRKHSERVHGIVLPLLIKRQHWKRIVLSKRKETTSVASIDKENSEKPYVNKDSCEKITMKTNLTSTVHYIKCTLCQRKVRSLRKHLIQYHKIGGSNVVQQLESSLLNETTSEDKKTTLTNEPHQDECRIMDNESNVCESPPTKKKCTLPHANTKQKSMLNNKRDAIVKNLPVRKKSVILTVNSKKCDVCLGLYASLHSLYKHKRIHNLRGETKENFHKFKCRYFNSPFNTKNRLSVKAKSSVMSANTVAKNTNNKINENITLQLNNSNTLLNQTSKLDRATRYSERMKKNNETTCICGRLFRNPHTLFIHKKSCELCQDEDATTQSIRSSSDGDSGIGINITIKKRNDSYEIVGKDDEDKPQKTETSNVQEETLSTSLSHTSNTKDFTEASTKQQVLDTSESSKYSKDHSILKLEDTDEDIFIDIEDDLQISINEDNATKQVITQEDRRQDSSEQQNDGASDKKIDKVFDKITLKQTCQEVLEVLEIRKSGNIENNKEYSRIKDQETCKENSQVKNQEIHQENKQKLRSKRYQYPGVELDHSYGTKVDTTQFDPLVCGYCKKRFSMIKSYDNHQCTVKHGKSFTEFSLQLLCFLCKEVLNNYNEFDEHVRIKHFDSVYHCYNCPEQFTSDKARLHHFHSEHGDQVCKFCNKKISLSAKALHEAYHLGFGYPCHKCKKAYINNAKLNLHKQTVHSQWSDNLMTCTICLKCVKINTFRHHMYTHKHNACHFCGKMFSDRIGVEYHTMMHHGINSKLKCNICGTRFHTKKQLEVHEKIDGCNNRHRMKKQVAIKHAKDH